MHRAAAIVLLFLFLGFGLRFERLGVRPVQVSLVFSLNGFDWRRMMAAKPGPQTSAAIQALSSPQAPSPTGSPSLAEAPSLTEERARANTPPAPDATANGNANSNEASANPDKPSLPVSLDIAQISRDGTSVFAGKSAPFAEVTVFDGKTEVATVTALANGDWSVATEHKFANPEPEINLKAAAHSEKNSAQQAHSGATPSTSEKSISGAQSGAIATAAASPAAQLMKEFEGVVATAREEAKVATAREEASHEKNDIGGKVAAPETSSLQPTAVIASSTPPVQANVEAHPPAQVKSDTAQSPTVTTAVPITFVYNEPTLTSDGQGAARLLLEYVKLKRFGTIALSGHADERGSQAYNMELSRQRLVTIERVLRDGGYHGQIDLVPKGSSEPFSGVVRSRFQREDLLQLDRRVELRVAK